MFFPLELFTVYKDIALTKPLEILQDFLKIKNIYLFLVKHVDTSILFLQVQINARVIMRLNTAITKDTVHWPIIVNRMTSDVFYTKQQPHPQKAQELGPHMMQLIVLMLANTFNSQGNHGAHCNTYCFRLDQYQSIVKMKFQKQLLLFFFNLHLGPLGALQIKLQFGRLKVFHRYKSSSLESSWWAYMHLGILQVFVCLFGFFLFFFSFNLDRLE